MSDPRPTDSRVEHVDKLEAAKRQLKTAIRLFFGDGDSVSIHTLTEAARSLLHDLLEAQEKISPLRQVEKDWIRPERWGDYLAIMNRPRNFFKHANKDPNEVLEFRPDVTAFLLFECAVMYQELTGRLLRECFVFSVWLALTYPQILEDGMLADAIRGFKAQLGPTPTKTVFLDVLNSDLRFPNVD